MMPACNPSTTPASRNRRGAVLVCAVVAMMIITGACVLLLRSSVLEHRELKRHEHLSQANWLVQSGLDRAIARLRADANYTGETWHITATEMSAGESLESNSAMGHAAVVTIRVQSLAEPPGLTSIIVSADYPADSPGRVRSSQRIPLAIASLKGKP